MKTVKMTVGELKHLVTEGGSMSPTMHMKSGASSRLRKILDAREKMFGHGMFRADEWERDLERLWELEPSSARALERDYINAYGPAGSVAGFRAAGPEFWSSVFSAMRADEKARDRRSSYEF